MLLSADSLTIIFVRTYCYWTRTVGVIAKGSRGPVFLRHSVYAYDLHRNYGRASTVEKFNPQLIFQNSNTGRMT